MDDVTAAGKAGPKDTLRIERAPFVQVPRWMLRAVSPRALQVWCALACYADSDGTSCFPGQPRVAADLDVSERTVRDALAELEAAEALEVRRTAGRGNAYTLRLTRPTPAETCRTPRQEPAAHPGEELPPTENHYREPPTEQPLPLASLAPSAEPRPEYPAAFEVWWQAYPRKVGKRAALKAWQAARKRTRADEVLLDGATRLAADPNLPGLEHVPHPTTWLNRDGWLDEPLPERDSPATRSTGSAVQGILERSMARAEAAERAALEGGDPR